MQFRLAGPGLWPDSGRRSKRRWRRSRIVDEW